MGIIIKRDHTFVCEGELFTVQKQGPYGSGDDAYDVQRDSGGPTHSFYRLSEVRKAFANGLPEWWDE